MRTSAPARATPGGPPRSRRHSKAPARRAPGRVATNTASACETAALSLFPPWFVAMADSPTLHKGGDLCSVRLFSALPGALRLAEHATAAPTNLRRPGTPFANTPAGRYPSPAAGTCRCTAPASAHSPTECAPPSMPATPT